GSAAHVSVALINLLQDVLAFVGFTGLLQRTEVLAVVIPASVDEHGQVAALDAVDLRVQDQHALQNILQLANIPRPWILLEQFDGVFADLNSRPPVLASE